MFITTVTAIYSLGHGLCTLTAVPRSTQPSTLLGTVKWVSAYELSNNNKWRWCLRMVAANLSADLAQIGWFGLGVGGHPALSLHSSNEPGELSQWLCHDDSTINIVVVIIIIIYYYYYYSEFAHCLNACTYNLIKFCYHFTSSTSPVSN